MYEINQEGHNRGRLNGSGMGLVLNITPMHAVPFDPEAADEGAEQQDEVGTRHRDWSAFWAGRGDRQQRRQASLEARRDYEAAAEQQAIDQRQARRATITTLGVGAGGLAIVSVLGYFGYRWWKGRDKEEG